MPMNATAVSHIAVCVRDLDESLKFYRDILGMTVTVDRVQDTSTGGLPHVYAHHRVTRSAKPSCPTATAHSPPS